MRSNTLIVLNVGLHRATRVLGVPLGALYKPSACCRIMTVGEGSVAVVPGKSIDLRLGSVTCFVAAGGRVPRVQGVINGRRCRSIEGVVVVNNKHATVRATLGIPNCVRIGVVRDSSRQYCSLGRDLKSGSTLIVGKSTHSSSLLVSRKVRRARTFITLAHRDRAGVLTYLATGHLNIEGAITVVSGVSCVSVTRGLSVNAVVGGGAVTTKRVCRVVLSTSMDGVGYLAITSTSITRFRIGTNTGIAGGPIGSLKLPSNMTVNKLIHGKRNVRMGNVAQVRRNSDMIMFYRGLFAGGLSHCFT